MELFKTNLKRFFTKIQKADRSVTTVDWAILAVLGIFIYFTMLFDDLIITYSHGLCFWDSLFSGELENFYSYVETNSWGGWTAYYYISLYIVFAVWNLPVWIVSKIVPIDVYSTACLLWAKGMNLFFIVLICILIRRILEDFEIENNKQRAYLFLFLSSLNLILPSLAMAQYDIICCFFSLWGFYEYCKSPKISYKCLLIFAIAITMKIYALFIVIPLILLKEKRLLYICKNLFIVIVGLVLCVWPYRDVFASGNAQSGFNSGWRDRLFSVTLSGGNSVIPCFVVLYCLICIYAYYKTCKNKNEECINANWIALSVLFCIFTFVYCHPQWIVLLTPFLTIMIALNGIKINYFLDLFLNIGISVYYCYYFNWVYGTELAFKYLIFNDMRIPYNEKYHNMAEMVDAHGFTVYMSSFFGIFVACAIALLIINKPNKEYVRTSYEIEANYLRLRLLPIFIYIVGTVLIAYVR